MVNPPLYGRTACRRTGQAPTMKISPIWCPQAFKARGFDSDLEEWNFYFESAKHLEKLIRKTLQVTKRLHPKCDSRARPRWRRPRSVPRRARRILDREILGPAHPLLKKRRRVMLSKRE
eukprot:4112158-Amphidinium_carterae.1